MNFRDSEVNDGSVTRRKATDYDNARDFNKKKAKVTSGPSLMYTFN